MQNFKDKRILFLDGASNLYHLGIIKALEGLGATVVPLVYGDFMDKSKMGWIKKKFLFKKITFNETKFLDAISGNFDIFFIKNPERGSKNVFTTLRQRFPKVPFINYNWNSVNHVDYSEYIPLFDKVYSFDPVDARKYNLSYYPLFYLPEFEKVAINDRKEFVISFVGSAFTPGRAKFMTKFFKLAKDSHTSIFLHLYAYSWKEYFGSKIFKNDNFKNSVSKKYVSHKGLLEIYKKSLSFIDHPMAIQNGHTMRTFETLASGLMLITTNKSLIDEPFFDSQRIQIIKEDLSDLDLNLVSQFTPSFPVGFEKYRVDNWLKKILSEN